MGAKIMWSDNNRNIQEMVDVASAFCRLIETVDESDSSWLQQMAGLLPRLHAAVGALQGRDATPVCLVNSDLDKRFEIYSRLHDRLGANDSYWLQFDVAHDGQSMSGSLADDLTDIYCDLKSGLSIMDVEPTLALGNWRSSYQIHWGQHLVDASRHLYELDSRRQLSS
jgi:Domain of unknown function (DUF5063)